MDLRKAILLKKPLQDTSLNNSGLSIYESAAEDSDSSLYFSFTNNSMKSFDISINEEAPSDLEHDASVVSEADNKENTVIMKDLKDLDEQVHKNEKEIVPEVVINEKKLVIKDIAKQKEENEQNLRNELQTEIVQSEDESMEVDTSVIFVENVIEERVEITQIQEDKETSVESEEEKSKVSSAIINKSQVIPQITVELFEDPNENLVNPFTMNKEDRQEIGDHSDFSMDENRKSIETDKVTKRKIQEANKKSASKIPTRTHFYSPVQRNSIDKKSKVIAKPTLQRRTIYETRSTTTKPKPPVVAPAKVTAPKTANPTLKRKTIYSSNQPSTSASNSFKCKWCDKVFELNTALNSHMLEKCPKISFMEKRKLLAQQDKAKQATDNKRKSVFVQPLAPKTKRSPRRQTLNKSGVMITPKKTLKCAHEGCGKTFTVVLDFANHMVTHKYEDALKKK